MKKSLLASALCLAANSSVAAVCDNSTGADILLFEEAKTAFLASNYEKFAVVAGPYFPDLQKDPDSLFGALKNALPGGFDRCVTVLQRRESPGFHQDLVLYFPRGFAAPIALLLIAVVVDGEPRMIEFNYNTNVSGVLEELK
ncbi:MAG: hypothetical protein ACR2O1_15950 [Boseongicola sp.]